MAASLPTSGGGARTACSSSSGLTFFGRSRFGSWPSSSVPPLPPFFVALAPARRLPNGLAFFVGFGGCCTFHAACIASMAIASSSLSNCTSSKMFFVSSRSARESLSADVAAACRSACRSACIFFSSTAASSSSWSFMKLERASDAITHDGLSGTSQPSITLKKMHTCSSAMTTYMRRSVTWRLDGQTRRNR